MPIEGLADLPRVVPLLRRAAETLYEVTLSAAPSPERCAAFLRPPAHLTTVRYTPELGRVGFGGTSVHFRTTPNRLNAWLRWIDEWIAYANSVVEE